MQNFIKTILNAVQTWTKKEIKKSKADWSQNDSSADNYVKNRTHWEEEVAVFYLKENNFTGFLDEGNGIYRTEWFHTGIECSKPLELNKQYYVVWDGVEYLDTLRETEGGYYLGHDYYVSKWVDTDLPFGIWFDYDGGQITRINVITSNSSEISHTLAIYENSMIVHKLDSKYLSDDIGLQPDWNQSDDTAKDYIKNRPFGKVENVLFENSIELNDGRYTFDESLELKYGTLYHVYIDNNKLSGICYYDSPDYYVYLTDSEGNHIGYMYDYAFVFSDGHHYEDGNYNLKVITVELQQIDLDLIPDSITTAISAIPTIRTTAESAQATADRKMDEANPVGTGSFSMNRKKNTTIGDYSHAEGYNTTASGDYSHAEGYSTIASYAKQNVFGSYNMEEPEWYIIERTDISINFGPYYDVKYASDYSVSEDGFFILYNYSGANHSGVPINRYYSFNDYNTIETDSNGNKYVKTDRINYKKSSTTADNYRRCVANGSDSGKYAHIVGNGTADDARSNAHTLDWDGNAWYSGDVYVGSTSGTNKDEGSKKLATEEYVDEALAGFEGNGGGNAESEVLCVTVQSNNDGYTADKTVSEIFEAYMAGKSVVCHVRDLDGNFATNLVVCTSDVAGFSASVGDVVITVMLTENGVQVEYVDILTKNDLPDDIGGGISVTGAKVGQTVRISAVNENGSPTAWEPADFPDYGGNVDQKANIGCKIIAHRGWHEVASQNTIPAFIEAITRGFKWLEIDIRKCSDGIYIMSHDATVTLYDNGSATSVTIASSKYSDIKNYTWDAAGKYKLCTLQAVFNTMKAYDVCMICDRKAGANSEIMAIASLCGVTDKVMLSYGSFSAAYGERTLLNKYDNIPIRCVPSDYANYETLATAISNPIFADVNASQTSHYQKYLNIALTCGVPILFSGCELTNANRWQVLAAGCMANNALNISYSDFYNAIANNYDIAVDIAVSNENVVVGVGDAVQVTAEASLQAVSGYVYAYSENPTIATMTQTAFGSAATITVTGVALGVTNIVFFCGNGEIKKVPVTVSQSSVATYTVTNNLTNASNSNTALTVNEGAAYTASISANAGYKLDNVTVTMGGIDITADVYSNGSINVPSVTGNIVITATTTQNTAKVYTVTNTLTNVTSNNSATSVEENASYNATLTAADGYEISAVTVTMGGTDVTSVVYADGMVAIPTVTGNVVITATAEAAQFKPVTVDAQYYIGAATNGYSFSSNPSRMMAYVSNGTKAYTNSGGDKYPIPIPDGASSMTIICHGFVPGIQILNATSRIADPGWQALNGATHDLTQYDGATHIALNFKNQAATAIPADTDTSGFSIVFN